MTFIPPGSAEWLKLITPSKVPSILGVSRFKSQFTLWHEMAGIVEQTPIKDAQQDDFDYGHAAEMAAAEYWKYKNPGWLISRGEVQTSNPALPFANLATVDRRGVRGSLRRVVEVKTARDLLEWGDDGSGIVPQDYTAQVITQQLITGWTDPANIVLWPQYGKPKIYVIEYDQQIATAIIERCQQWMTSLTELVRPPLDDSISCYETVKALHPDIDDTDAPIDPELAADYLATNAALKAAKKREQGLKTRLLDAMGSSHYAVVGDQRIADRRPARGDSVALYPNPKIDPQSLLTKGVAA
ncbi:YqaJ viral recombinase family protein [Williamsia sp. D3]|uniref:YqaJ viral recombinase family protein n=1 Tax=Williamsia sp. D3 TaxID=1313067 RepID=UPI0003D30180|nr:YqaJ viral recombinase family protein [Williamsia sp. D3]ETD31241.1 hypothetical protein W823_19155 [Williamsia sp. D3]